jgi:hypothetical protein
VTDPVAAHDQMTTLHVIAHIPEHLPRAGDPAYALFNAARARLKKLGLLTCIINDAYCGGGPELHHSHVEFSQSNAMDLDKINKVFGQHLTDDGEFQAWIEGPGNLEVLCVNHHRTSFGIHVLPAPLWEPLRYRKAGVAAGGEFVAAKDLSMSVGSGGPNIPTGPVDR